MKVLVTGAAGFIGAALVRRLLSDNHDVIGLDNMNDYYDIRLKNGRLFKLGILGEKISCNVKINSELYDNFQFIKLDLENRNDLFSLFDQERFDTVCNLAAQAGVRYSLENPYSYINSNVVGYINILEACRSFHIKHLVYASSSSVYGHNVDVPFSENSRTDEPVSLYAATKKSNELMSYTYSKLYNIPTTGLRFFTVYGPWGRPDMAPFIFANAIINGNPINVFNEGNLSRDFTYIDDIVEGVVKVIYNPLQVKEGIPPYKIYNIGCSSPVKLMDFITILEDTIGRKAKLNMLPMQQGDVYQTYADTSMLERDFNYKPQTTLSEGIEKFIRWYKLENPIR